MVPSGHHVQSHYGPVAIVFSLLVAIVKHVGFIWGGNAQQAFICMMMTMMSESARERRKALYKSNNDDDDGVRACVCACVCACVGSRVFSFLSLSLLSVSQCLLAYSSIGQWSIVVKTLSRVNPTKKRKEKRGLLHCWYFCDPQTWMFNKLFFIL